MLAAVYQAGRGMVLEQRERGGVGPDQALLKVETCGICGTDLRIQAFGHHRLAPGQARILGHELSGTIIETGSAVSGLEVGQRVAVAPNMGCGGCELCIRGFTQLCPDYISFGVGLDGGFAETLLLPEQALRQGNIAPLPDAIDFESAALLEPLSCCYHGLMACNPRPGDTALVYGAGPIGLMHLQLARLMGARRVFCASSHPERLDLFPFQVADNTLDPQDDRFEEVLLDLTEGRGVDLIIVATGSRAAQAQALKIAAVHGRINFFSGLPKTSPLASLDSNAIHYKELLVTGTTGQTLADFRACLGLLGAERVHLRELISHRFALNEIEAAFEVARQKSGLKVMVEPGSVTPG